MWRYDEVHDWLSFMDVGSNNMLLTSFFIIKLQTCVALVFQMLNGKQVVNRLFRGEDFIVELTMEVKRSPWK